MRAGRPPNAQIERDEAPRWKGSKPKGKGVRFADEAEEEEGEGVVPTKLSAKILREVCAAARCGPGRPPFPGAVWGCVAQGVTRAVCGPRVQARAQRHEMDMEVDEDDGAGGAGGPRFADAVLGDSDGDGVSDAGDDDDDDVHVRDGFIEADMPEV